MSVVISTINLTLSACRTFYVQRSPEFADPQPTVHMTLRVFLYMLIQVSLSLHQGSDIIHKLSGAVRHDRVVSDLDAQGVPRCRHVHLFHSDLYV